MDFFSLSVEDCLRELNSSKSGLTSEEAEKRLKKFGLNKLIEKKSFSVLKIFLNQFNSFLVYILIVAGLISFFFGEQLDAIAIFAIIVLNAIIGFIQEFKAENALLALKKMVSLNAVVLRDGVKRVIKAEELVPGDIIYLSAGDKVPADARLIQCFNLKVDESILTGESLEVSKTSEVIRENVSLSKRNNLVFSNSIITNGEAIAVVTRTGMKTEFGKIAGLISESKEEKTLLNKQLNNLGKNLGFLIVGIIIVLFFLGLIRGFDLLNLFMISISLGVSAIPEGLPVVVTLTLAFGVQKMVKHKAIVRKINSIESLGATTMICSDKTGTLTLNELTVKKVFFDEKELEINGLGYNAREQVSVSSDSFKKILMICENCNNSFIEFDSNNNGLHLIGDRTELALKVLVKKTGLKLSLKKLSEKPFDSTRKMMSTLHEFNGEKIVLVKGAPEKILLKSTKTLVNGEFKKLSNEEKKELLKKSHEWEAKALRVLGFGFKYNSSKDYEENNLIFLGFTGLIDPPRKEVKQAIKTALNAGIQLKIITGDSALTAKAIAQQVGLKNIEVIEGKELDLLSEKEFSSIVASRTVFARTNPEHKLKIVKELKKQGHVVAVTGDGVNDAPALKEADVGIAMGVKGSEVTKEASDIVLKDDNFATIVSAIREGRIIYKNILAFVKFLLSANFDTIAVVGILTIFGFPLPILPLQILWINLATDALPALALGTEKPSGVMREKPRKKNESLFKKFWLFILIAVIIQILANLAIFFYGYQEDLLLGINPFDLTQPSHIRTLFFTEIVLFELFLVFNCRQENKTFLELNPLSNKSLIIAVIISLLLQLIIIYHPLMQTIFKTLPLNSFEWIALLLISSTALLVPYIERTIKKIMSLKD